MASFADTVFENEVRKLLNDKGDAESRAVLAGTPQTIEQYREQVGYLRGLKDALKFCDEARRLIAGEPPKTDPETRKKMATKVDGVI